jgi:ribosomal protein L3
LKIIKIDKINKLIAIKGAVPGRRGALVKITQRI